MEYKAFFEDALGRLKAEKRYRVFVDLERDAAHFPYARWHRDADTVEDVINFYIGFSSLDRAGLVRNGDPQLKGVLIDSNAVVPLAAFLRSLNEDYTDIPCPCQ